MKRVFLLVLVFIMSLVLVGCKESKDSSTSFMEKLSEAEGYKVEGVLETFFENGRRQSEFCVFYKKPDNIKVVLESIDNNDKQIILKKSEDVYVLVPSVNKSFKIKSTWPTNASYPYLLQSLAQDIANDKDSITSENDTTYTIQTKIKMHTDADVVNQKIIISKETLMPTEVLIYEADGDLFTRCVFTSIDLKYKPNDDEFDIDKSMTTAYLTFGENGLEFKNRSFDLPTYCPEGLTLKANENVKKGEDARSVMLFSGDKNLTIVQELVNYDKEIKTSVETGEVVMVMGTVGIMNNNSIKFIFEGIEYTVASNTLPKSELLNVSYSYMQPSNK